MNTISDIMFWISTGLLVPVVVLLIALFFRALLLVGSFFGQYMAIRKTDKIIREQMEGLTPDKVDELAEKLPAKTTSLVVVYMRRILEERHSSAQVQRL
ncbi:MAG: MotA/TolQ/ExbB proton channel family protein, partial [Odoribacter sp.]|nr:MotA/TolQ/ExbB proton channel family protein [Odoribacter sp.]